MKKSKAKSDQKIKPLYIYLAGSVLGMISGIAIRPISEGLHSAVILLSIGICLYGIYRHFKS